MVTWPRYHDWKLLSEGGSEGGDRWYNQQADAISENGNRKVELKRIKKCLFS